jgi:hypothetical protein
MFPDFYWNGMERNKYIENASVTITIPVIYDIRFIIIFAVFYLHYSEHHT